MESLKELRKSRGFTQEQISTLIGVPRRTYQRHESNKEDIDMEKLRHTINKILGLEVADKNHGILSLNEITRKVRLVCKQYPEIECVYLFGSYARSDMTEKSDIDLFYVAPELKGFNVSGFYGDICESLIKDVDLLNSGNISGDERIINEIFKDGIKIYEK